MVASAVPIARCLVLFCMLGGMEGACGQPTSRGDAGGDAGDKHPTALKSGGGQPPERSARTDASEPAGPALLAKVRSLIKAKQWREAIVAADAAVDGGVRDAEVYLLRGRAHEALDEYDEAEAALFEAFRLARTSPDALFLLAESAERRGRRRRCEQLYRRILDEVDARFVPAREQLVRLYLNTRRLDRAAECFRGFERLEQTGPAVARCEAYLNFRRNRGEDRLAAYQAELRRIIERYPADARTHIDLAMTHLASGESLQALAQTDKALAIDAADVRARELKATVATKLLRFDVAAETLRGLLADRPRSAHYLQGLLDLAMNRADFDAAAAMLRRLLAREDLRERHATYKGRLIEVLLSGRRFEEAIETAKQWLDESPYDDLRRLSYLSALNKAGDHDQAVDEAASWLAEEPANSELRVRLVGQLAGAERFVEAQQHLLSWLADEPDDVDLNVELIRVCLLAGQWDCAIELARLGAERTEHQSRYEEWLGRSYVLSRRFDDAVGFYQERLNLLEAFRRRAGAIGDNPSQRLYDRAVRGAYGNLISTLVAAERFTEAEQTLTRLLLSLLQRRDAGDRFDPSWLISLRRSLATIYQLTDRPTQATQQLEEILEMAPSDPGINNDLGYTWADAGLHLERAERMIRLAVGEAPRQAAYLDSLGWVLYKRGEIDGAVHYLRLAVRHAESPDPVMLDHLGDALYRVGHVEEAGTNWEKALELSGPVNDPPPNADDRRLHRQVELKLERLRNDEVVQTAPVVGSATTRPTVPEEPVGQRAPAGGR